MWVRDFPGIYESLKRDWPEAYMDIIAAILEATRHRAFYIVAQAFSSINVDVFAAYLDVSVNDAVKSMFIFLCISLAVFRENPRYCYNLGVVYNIVSIIVVLRKLCHFANNEATFERIVAEEFQKYFDLSKTGFHRSCILKGSPILP